MATFAESWNNVLKPLVAAGQTVPALNKQIADLTAQVATLQAQVPAAADVAAETDAVTTAAQAIVAAQPPAVDPNAAPAVTQ